MKIEIDRVGQILEGDEKGWYVYVFDDAKETGGYLILTFNSLSKTDESYEYFDGWVESIEDLNDYFDESSWKI